MESVCNIEFGSIEKVEGIAWPYADGIVGWVITTIMKSHVAATIIATSIIEGKDFDPEDDGDGKIIVILLSCKTKEG